MARTNLGRVGMVFRGAYDAAASYRKLDAVTYLNGAYVAIADGEGNLPTDATHWQPLVALDALAADLSQAVTDADAATDAANEAALNANSAIGYIAGAFSPSVPYFAGAYVIKDGALYRFTAKHEAGAWTGEDVQQISVGTELTSLSHAREDIAIWGGANIFNPYALIERTDLDATTGEPVPSEYYDVTDYIDVTGYASVTFKLFDYTGAPNFIVYLYDSEKSFISRKGNASYLPGRVVTFATADTRTTCFIRIRAERPGHALGSVNPFRAMVVLGTQTITDFVPYFSANDWVTRAHTLFLKYGVYTGADANDIDENCRYVCQKGSVSNLPDGDAITLFILETAFTTENHSTGYQIATNMTTGARYWRSRFSSAWAASWSDYSVTADMFNALDEHTVDIKYGAYTGADADAIDENSRYVCQTSVTGNLPASGSTSNTLYILETAFTTKNHSTGYQIAYNMTTGARYWRSRFSSAWSSDWLDYSVSAAMLEKLREETIAVKYSAYSGTDADTVADNSRWSCLGKNVDHLPTNSGAYVLETNYTNAAHTSGFQQAYRLADGKRFWRFVHGGTWEPWETWDVDDRGSHPKYIALGDSLMYGAVWSQELADKSKKWYQAAEINRIPTRIAHAVGADDSFVNAAVSGAYFVGSESGDKIINQVKGADLTDVSLITLAGGRNDTTHPLGTSADTAGTATVCGEVRAIIEYIQTNAPKCQIVMIQVTPHAETYEEVFATGYHGYWSLNDYKAEMLKICADYCVPFVDWEGCSLFRHWPSFTSAANNYVHPDTEDTYAQMGNYIAGRVAAYYHG